MEYNFNTADNLEDLCIDEELYSYEGVYSVSENYQILQEEYRDKDFFILASSEAVEKIKELLMPLGYTAYIETDDDLIEI